MNSQHAYSHLESTSPAIEDREHVFRAIRGHLIDEMNVDVPDAAAAPIGEGEMTRWPCAEPTPNTPRRQFREVVPIGRDVSTRVSPIVIAAAAAVLLVYSGGSLVAAMLISLEFIAPAVIFAVLAVVLLLAAIPGNQSRFRSKLCSFDQQSNGG